MVRADLSRTRPRGPVWRVRGTEPSISRCPPSWPPACGKEMQRYSLTIEVIRAGESSSPHRNTISDGNANACAALAPTRPAGQYRAFLIGQG